MAFDFKKIYKEEAMPKLMKETGYKNIMSVPKIEKVSINIGTGSIKDEEQKKRMESNLTLIIGQKLSTRPAKKSIASFKTRKGMPLGFGATLRGKRMYDFLNKMVFVALPRRRDFRGLDINSVDESGNLTVGFKDNLVFPEMAGQDIKHSFGFSATIVTTAKNKKEGVEFFKAMKFPFSK
ncbi:MAG: 50S ribosomal protein L5 [Candidatus Pacebacteria bacterium]|nr:50S ribosomal protein L5 [Candidatus Paceibacterota bacterium]